MRASPVSPSSAAAALSFFARSFNDRLPSPSPSLSQKDVSDCGRLHQKVECAAAAPLYNCDLCCIQPLAMTMTFSEPMTAVVVTTPYYTTSSALTSLSSRAVSVAQLQQFNLISHAAVTNGIVFAVR